MSNSNWDSVCFVVAVHASWHSVWLVCLFVCQKYGQKIVKIEIHSFSAKLGKNATDIHITLQKF
jgi:hypothetical protein